MEVFKDIKIIQRSGKPDPISQNVESLGWKFNFKGKQYGNYIDSAIYGKTYIDEDGLPYKPIIGTKDITIKDQIKLISNMVEAMKHLAKK